MAILLGATTVTVERYTGSVVAHEWTPVLESSFSAQLSVQPINGRERQDLPEGYRTRRIVKAFGQPSPKLRTTDLAAGASNDIVIYKGDRFDVISVEDWDIGPPNPTRHIKYLLAEIGADGNI